MKSVLLLRMSLRIERGVCLDLEQSKLVVSEDWPAGALVVSVPRLGDNDSYRLHCAGGRKSSVSSVLIPLPSRGRGSPTRLNVFHPLIQLNQKTVTL